MDHIDEFYDSIVSIADISNKRPSNICRCEALLERLKWSLSSSDPSFDAATEAGVFGRYFYSKLVRISQVWPPEYIPLNQPLLNPSAFPLYAQAKELSESTRYQSVDDKRQLAFDAAHAFFQVLLSDEVVQDLKALKTGYPSRLAEAAKAKAELRVIAEKLEAKRVKSRRHDGDTS